MRTPLLKFFVSVYPILEVDAIYGFLQYNKTKILRESTLLLQCSKNRMNSLTPLARGSQ
jgi:hypothetical protein